MTSISVLLLLLPSAFADTTQSTWLAGQVTSVPQPTQDVPGLTLDNISQICGTSCSEATGEGSGRFMVRVSRSVTHVNRASLNDATEYNWAAGQATTDLGLLGLDPSDVRFLMPRFIVYETNDPVRADQETAVGLSVFVGRQYGGLEVVDNTAVASYDMDHGFRAVSATWPKLSAQRSTWSLPTDGECALQNIDSWVNNNVVPYVDQNTLEVYTALVPDPDDEGVSDGVPVVLTVVAEGTAGSSSGSYWRTWVCGEDDDVLDSTQTPDEGDE